MEIKTNDLKKVVKVANLAGRLSELEGFKGYVGSERIARRRSILKSQLRELLGEEKEKSEEQVVNIKINLPAEEVKPEKKKSATFSLGNLLKGKFNFDEEEDDELVHVISSILPEEDFLSVRKIVKEL